MLPSARLLPMCLGAWCLSVAGGFWWINSYSAAAGDAGLPVYGSELTTSGLLGNSNARLVLFAHPRCPCSRASLTELIHVVEQTNAVAEVVFWEPTTLESSDDADWRHTELTTIALEHPLLNAKFDPGGQLATMFGAKTSGHCLAFDRAGKLRFTGGITSGRGHEGANKAQQTLVSLLTCEPSTDADLMRFPVFGCRLAP